MDLIP